MSKIIDNFNNFSKEECEYYLEWLGERREEELEDMYNEIYE